MTSHPTPIENIVIDHLFEWLSERRENRSMAEYAAIARRVPKIDAVYAYVNERLRALKANGIQPYEICRFGPGSEKIVYEPYPVSVSRETVRKALKNFGLWRLR
jgi:hypothetical protein